MSCRIMNKITYSKRTKLQIVYFILSIKKKNKLFYRYVSIGLILICLRMGHSDQWTPPLISLAYFSIRQFSITLFSYQIKTQLLFRVLYSLQIFCNSVLIWEKLIASVLSGFSMNSRRHLFSVMHFKEERRKDVVAPGRRNG